MFAVVRMRSLRLIVDGPVYSWNFSYVKMSIPNEYISKAEDVADQVWAKTLFGRL